MTSLFSTQLPEPLHIIGSKQIDTIWTSPQILLSSISIIPHYFSIGDHRAIVADFLKNTFFGDRYIPIIRPEIRRLLMAQPQSISNYIKRSKQLFIHHQI